MIPQPFPSMSALLAIYIYIYIYLEGYHCRQVNGKKLGGLAGQAMMGRLALSLGT